MKSGPKFCPLRPAPFGGVPWALVLLGWMGCAGALLAQPTAARVVPSNVTVDLESAMTLCVEAQGAGPLLYQWQKNGLNLPGQTNRCLALTNIAIADGGGYRALVINASGALASEEGTLIVALTQLPGTDQFLNRALIMAISNSVTGTSFVSSREENEPPHFGLSTSNSVWYTWRAPASGVVTFDTRGSTFDTVLAVYTGNSFATLSELVSDDDGGGFHASQVSWNAQAGVDYQIAIDGVTGETGTYVCSWSLSLTPGRLPVITLPPQSQTVPAGQDATFVALVQDPDPNLSFQWFHNGQRIPGATAATLLVPLVQAPQLGQYWLAVTNSSGRGVVTSPVHLEIGPIASVQSQDKLAAVGSDGGGGGGGGFAMAAVSPGTFSLAAGTIINQRFFNGGTMDRCEPAHCGVPGGASRWFQLAATEDGVCTLDTQGSDVDTVLAVYLQNFSICTNLYEPLVECNNDTLGGCEQVIVPNGPRNRSSRISFMAAGGTIYRVVVDSAGGVRGTNVQFNVRFETGESLPTNAVSLHASGNCVLHDWGTSLALKVGTNISSLPGNLYQWQVNGRRIAGAAQATLILPFLNYADAGRYSVTIQNGSNRTVLPGATVAVVAPCRSGLQAPFQLLGSTAEPLLLEAATALRNTSAWEVVASILPSMEPTIWNVGLGSNRFYRVSRSAP